MNISKENLHKLKSLHNGRVTKIVETVAELCRPEKISVITDSENDAQYVRRRALEVMEETPLRTPGHTVHFDGYYDQGRDKENTRVLIPKGEKLCGHIKTMDRDEGLEEIGNLLEGIMEGKEMFVRFFCLGPKNSKFTMYAFQITDSAYVAHSEDILYRRGYEAFKELRDKNNFFYFIHSAGELEKCVSKNIDKRRVYIDLEKERVFAINTQYAGNSVGLKKLALRLAISRADKEKWLCEHMFISGVHNNGRITYFTGAFPSACGKTSTAMLPGNTIVGDDIAYLRPGEDGNAYAVNIEKGIFGIIENLSHSSDPLIYEALTSPKEVIFSNILVANDTPYWSGMGKEFPKMGKNFAGDWKEGMAGPDGKPVPLAHKNARYTVSLHELKNVDKNLDNPNGVKVDGFIYGGRDSDASVPVFQSFSWHHGVFIGSCLESETTSATIGAEGQRKHNPMANLDFLVIPLGTYIQNHIAFGEALDRPPIIFATNYFLKENGKFLNGIMDKLVWLQWMERRTHNDLGVIETPIGYIPLYEDLKTLFTKYLKQEYAKADYEKQFTIRTHKLLEKFQRVEESYKGEEVPEYFADHLRSQRDRLLAAQKKYGKENISPFEFASS